jgi:hypothetical protein
MMGRGGASSGGARRGISAADAAASGWLQQRSSACSREASKMMGRAMPPTAGLLYGGLLFDAAVLARVGRLAGERGGRSGG